MASLWFLPTCVGVSAFLVSRVMLWTDRNVDRGIAPSWLFTGDGAAAAQVTSTLTAAMLAFVAVVFSTTLVAVQLASSQYSPRIVRVFVRSRVTQLTLATFLSAFVFSLNAMAATRSGGNADDLPVLTMSALYVLVVATVGMFVVFFHRIVRLLRVQYLFLSISHESQRVIRQDFPEEEAYTAVAEPDPVPDPTLVRHRGHPGVLQAIDVGGLAEAARRAGAWVEMEVAVGGHLGHRTPIARVHHCADGSSPCDVRPFLLVGGERTQLQDAAFGIRQLVDAACRALSPAVNDPTTAVQAAHRTADLLSRIGERPDPTGWYTDLDGTARVKLLEDGFERLAVLAFTEIVRYGADSPQVVRCLRAVYDELQEQMPPERRLIIDQLRAQLHAAAEKSMPTAFLDISRTADSLGLG